MINIKNLKLDIEEVNMDCCLFKWLFGKKKNNSTGCIEYNGIKLLRERKECIGFGMHRTGWPWVFDFLETLDSKKGILFDDFIEQNFCYKHNPTIYNEPWVGIFHHPPSIPYFGNMRESLDYVFQTEEFIESAKNLKLAIALSDYLGDFLKTKLNCPVLVLKHPASANVVQWDINKFNNNKQKYLVQMGYYLRNTQLIGQIPNIKGYKKIRLWNRAKWLQEYDCRVQKHFERTRYNYKGYVDLRFLVASKYDELLSKSIVVTEIFEASASNGVLDCIVRNTPLIINKHPAVVEYLGNDYPLYFEDPNDIPKLYNKIEEAHQYLLSMDKTWLSGEQFTKNIMVKINEEICHNMRKQKR